MRAHHIAKNVEERFIKKFTNQKKKRTQKMWAGKKTKTGTTTKNTHNRNWGKEAQSAEAELTEAYSIRWNTCTLKNNIPFHWYNGGFLIISFFPYYYYFHHHHFLLIFQIYVEPSGTKFSWLNKFHFFFISLSIFLSPITYSLFHVLYS